MNSKLFLLLSAFSLASVGCLYGIAPDLVFDTLWGIQIEEQILKHVFRGVMGIYFALAFLWFRGAMNPSLRIPALISLVFISFGIAGGRTLSVLIDGVPHWMFLGFLGAELVLGALGLYFWRQEESV